MQLRYCDLPAVILQWILLGWSAMAYSGDFDSAATEGTIPPAEDIPRIAIIIDDLGHSWRDAERVLALPGPVACSILPHTRFGPRIAKAARQLEKEVLLHLPMESLGEEEPGPGKLTQGMPLLEVQITLERNLANLANVAGINNHMGSGLTASYRDMAILMQALANYPWMFFVDSLTTPASVARKAARDYNVPSVSRHIFLDHERDSGTIARQFNALVLQAKQRGYAVGIGHPVAETINLLEQQLPRLQDQGLALVPVSQLVASQYKR